MATAEMNDSVYTFIKSKFLQELGIPLTDEQSESHWSSLTADDREEIIILIEDQAANYTWEEILEEFRAQRDPVKTELTGEIMAIMAPYFRQYLSNLGVEDISDGQIYQMWQNLKEPYRRNWLLQASGQPPEPIPFMVEPDNGGGAEENIGDQDPDPDSGWKPPPFRFF